MARQPRSPVPAHRVLSRLEETRESVVELIQLRNFVVDVPEVLILKKSQSRRKTQEIEVHCLLVSGRTLCPSLYYYEKSGDEYKLAMQYFPKGSLAARIQNQGKLRSEEALRLALDLLQVLSFMHLNSITHGDVKPLNVLCAEDDHYVLCDFGHAKLHVREDSNFEADQVNDSYSAGCTLLEALVGRLGLSLSSNPLSFLSKIAADQLPVLVTVLTGLLKIDPKQRMRCSASLQFLRESTELSTDTLRYHTRHSSQSFTTTVMSRYEPLYLEESVAQAVKRFEAAVNTMLEIQTPQTDLLNAKVDELLNLLEASGGTVRAIVKGECSRCCMHEREDVLRLEAVHLRTCACVFCKRCLNSFVLSGKETVVKDQPLVCRCGQTKFLPLEELRDFLYPTTIAELDEYRLLTFNIRCPRCKQITNEIHGRKAKTVTCLRCDLSFCCYCYNSPHQLYCSKWRNRNNK